MSLNVEFRARVFRGALRLWSCLFGCIVVAVVIRTDDLVLGMLAAFEVLLPVTIVGAGVLAVGAALQRTARRNISRLHGR